MYNTHRSIKSRSIRNLIQFGSVVLALSTHAADILPSASRTDWSKAGVPGGIPQRSTIYTTLDSGATASQIQTALNNCPAGQVVFLAAGTYSLSTSLRINRDNITLRGAVDSAGKPTTVLNFTSAASGWGLIDLSKTTYPTNPSNVRDITSGFARGSNSITLSSAPTGLQTGQILALDQVADDNLVWDNGTEGGNTWGRNGNRTLTQFVRVTGINNNVVTFDQPIYSEYWNSGGSPQAYWWGSGTSQTVAMSGVEDLRITRPNGGGGTHNIAIGPADSCWVKNVWSTQCQSAHVRTGWTLNCEIRDCYLTLHDNVGSATYAVWLSYSSAALVENNIMAVTPCALGLMSTSGSVLAFNFTTNFPYSQSNWLPECIMTHGGHNHFNLFEGNYVPSFWADWIHGNASRNTYARNRVLGWESGKTGSTRAINIEQNQDNLSVIGNVLGTSSYHTSYDSGGTAIYNVSSDSLPTLLRKGNFNTVNNGISAGESLGSDSIGSSYFRTNKPSWFGDRPWPAFDPSASAAPTNLPAGYRYTNGTWPSAASGVPQAPSDLRTSP
jgi:hypothetical protein